MWIVEVKPKHPTLCSSNGQLKISEYTGIIYNFNYGCSILV